MSTMAIEQLQLTIELNQKKRLIFLEKKSMRTIKFM